MWAGLRLNSCIVIQIFSVPLHTADKVFKLLDYIHATVQLLLDVPRHALTITQQKGCIAMIHQVNECFVFLNTYVRQPYRRLLYAPYIHRDSRLRLYLS